MTMSANALTARIGLALASLLLGAALVMGFKSPDSTTVAGGDQTGTGSTSGTGSSSGGTNTSGGRTASGGTATSGSGAAGTQTVSGTLIQTRYGDVQVQVTVANGKITSVTALALPSGGRSGMISAYAEPILTNEALSAQSAQINLVSGATYTSTAYEQSLQAALDQAGV
ncbi:MAG TPA: FMN-binding protein [Candidatus Limnocylindrales bacterium]|nr:FMN-binding protein [Candidatus Limnocylindrales bacterium]